MATSTAPPTSTTSTATPTKKPTFQAGMDDDDDDDSKTASDTTATTATTSSSTPSKATSNSDGTTPKGWTGRMVGRWYLGETLGKGGYSWVKKGKDKNTGRVVALKFMDRKKAGLDGKNAVDGWNRKQLEMVATEIECLRMVKHPNVMKLMAYNFNAIYPNKNGSPRDVILLVLEYMSGGELFDILYYTSNLEEILARTYLKQLVKGLEACHSQKIVHRDIKPQNLLLDSKYILKITDFGLAKYASNRNSKKSKNEKKDDDESNSNTNNENTPDDPNIDSKTILMQTFNVGTRGYQAPEILAKKPYGPECDVFSIGVVLFVLLAGYPPFEHARENDRWYRFIATAQYRKFWKAHRGCGIQPQAIDLITRMLTFDPAKRISLSRIKRHPWCKGDTLSSSQLTKVLRLRHEQMEIKRKNDPVKASLLASVGVPTDRFLDLDSLINFNGSAQGGTAAAVPVHYVEFDTNEGLIKVDASKMAPLLPEEEGVGLRDRYSDRLGYVILHNMQKSVQGGMGGQCYVNVENFSMEVHIAAQSEDVDQVMTESVHFGVYVYYYQTLRVNLVKFKRLAGSFHFWKSILAKFIKLSEEVLTGLPKNRARLLNELSLDDRNASAESDETNESMTSSATDDSSNLSNGASVGLEGYELSEEDKILLEKCFPDPTKRRKKRTSNIESNLSGQKYK